jgi:hypothetical protein
MITTLSLEYLCFANSAEYDRCAQLPTYFFPERFLATGRPMPRFSALEAYRGLARRTVKLRILQGLALDTRTAPRLHAEACHHVGLVAAELFVLRH